MFVVADADGVDVLVARLHGADGSSVMQGSSSACSTIHTTHATWPELRVKYRHSVGVECERAGRLPICRPCPWWHGEEGGTWLRVQGCFGGVAQWRGATWVCQVDLSSKAISLTEVRAGELG